ncbi:hypothetical protein [Erythrobacter aureus]|uniref:hypothetical protein n=1 Tax=Erythrobacter aureus TaxID=2182384 RepID=UPI003A95B898
MSENAESEGWRKIDAERISFSVPQTAEVTGVGAIFQDLPVYGVLGEGYVLEIRFESVPPGNLPIVVRDGTNYLELGDEAGYAVYARQDAPTNMIGPVFATRCKGECPEIVWKIIQSVERHD